MVVGEHRWVPDTRPLGIQMRAAVAAMLVVILGLDLAVVATRGGHPLPRRTIYVEAMQAVAMREVASLRMASSSTTAAAAPATTATAPAATTPAPPSTEAAPPSTAPPSSTTTGVPPTIPSYLTPVRPGAWTLGPYEGLGVWLDVYDWTAQFTGGNPRVVLADIDRMADTGIQTLFLQTGHRRSPTDVIEPERLMPLIERAHARGMAVVAWYLPMLEDVPTDLRRLVASAQLPVDGLGVDIESLAVSDPAERTRRLLDLSTQLRQAVGTKAIAAITPSAVHLQVVNPNFWPGFPWPELAATYDTIVPMAYWSVRKQEWRQGEKYIGENIDRIRASTGRPDMPIHIAGGIADGVTPDDLAGMVRAIQARGVMGGSLYDWRTSSPPQWDVLKALRFG